MHEKPLVDLDQLVSKVEKLREAEPYLQVHSGIYPRSSLLVSKPISMISNDPSSELFASRFDNSVSRYTVILLRESNNFRFTSHMWKVSHRWIAFWCSQIS